MNLTQQELETIEKLAGLFYTPKQIAIILEIDPEMFEAHIRSETGNTEHITRAITKLISNSGKASHNLHYQVAHRHKQCSGIFKNKAEFQNNSYICKNINCLKQ